MNIALECEVTLSKKIEAICESGEPVSIFISSVSGNKGRAIMRLVCKDGTTNDAISKIGETSIQFKVVGASEDVKSLEDAAKFTNLISSGGTGLPPVAEGMVARTNPDVPQGEPHPLSSKPANPLEGITGNAETIRLITTLLAAAGVNIPTNAIPAAAQQAAQPQAPQQPVQRQPVRPPDNSIKNYDELTVEITALPGVNQEMRLPVDRKLTRNEADQILARMPKLRRKAYVRNTMQSQLLIGDLFTSLDGSGPCLALLPGQAYDLTRLPAKNILNSNDFRWAIETGRIAFVGLAEYAASFKQMNEEAAKWGTSELRVYGGETARTAPTDPSGGVAESLAAGGAMMDDKEGIRIGQDGPDPIAVNVETGTRADEAPPQVPYEESPEMQMLLGQLPMTKEAPQQGVPRRMR